MEEKLGIEKTKSLLVATARLVKEVDKSLEDQNISPLEWAKIAMKAVPFAIAVSKFKQIKAEYADYDADEKLEIVETFKAEFKLRNEEAEAMIEEIFAGLMHFAKVAA
jgi:hypothetical protein